MGGLGEGWGKGTSALRARTLGMEAMKLPRIDAAGGGVVSAARAVELLIAWGKGGSWDKAVRSVRDSAAAAPKSEEAGAGLGGGICEGAYLRAVFGQMRRWRAHGIDKDAVDRAAEIVGQHNPCSAPGERHALSSHLRLRVQSSKW